MAMEKKKEKETNVINFRCPDNLKLDIAKIGKDYYPNDKNDRGYDLTSTILAILSKGIEGIAKEGLCITDSKTECNTLDNFTATKTELEAAIADLKQNFENQLGEFKSLVFNEVITMGVMDRAIETAIDNRLKTFQFESVASLKQETIQAITQPIESLPLLDELDNRAIAVSTIPVDNLAITPEKTIDNAPKTDETNNQDDSPITDTENLEGLNTRQLATTLGIPYTTLKDLKKQILEGREIDPKRKHYEKFSQWELRGEFWYKK
jgi:hypothetical protein